MLLLILMAMVPTAHAGLGYDSTCTFYVSYVAGSDGAAGTSPSAAFKTIQHAIDKVKCKKELLCTTVHHTG